MPINWDTHIDYLLSKASSRLYVLRICKYYRYSIEHLDLLFQSLILLVFTYAIEVWGVLFIVNIYVQLISSLPGLISWVTA